MYLFLWSQHLKVLLLWKTDIFLNIYIKHTKKNQIFTGMKTIIASTVKEDTPTDTVQTLEIGNRLVTCREQCYMLMGYLVYIMSQTILIYLLLFKLNPLRICTISQFLTRTEYCESWSFNFVKDIPPSISSAVTRQQYMFCYILWFFLPSDKIRLVYKYRHNNLLGYYWHYCHHYSSSTKHYSSTTRSNWSVDTECPDYTSVIR